MNQEKYILTKLVEFLARKSKSILETLVQKLDHDQTNMLRGEFLGISEVQVEIKNLIEEVKKMEKKKDE